MSELSSSPPSVAPASAVPSPGWQAAVGASVILVAAAMAWGALEIPGNAGYGGVGPNFLPWLCAAVLALCGVLLVREALTGGYRQAADGGGAARAALVPFAWVSAGLLLNAGLIEHLGFIISCTLAYVLAVQGLRRAYGKPHDTWLVDVITGFLISAPVYWMFTKFLAINLPGLTSTGWI